MIKLLNAGFERLKKNKIFWLLTIFSIGLALIIIYASYADMTKYGDVIEVEQLIVDYSVMIGIVISIFTSLFLGVEYSDGGIRNKISIGHKRLNIYVSNLIIITITSLFSYLLYMLVIIVIGIPLFGSITMSYISLLKFLGCIATMILSYTSIFTFIAMLIHNKTITAVVSIMLSFGLMMISLTCLNILETPKYTPSASLVDGEMKFEETLNPKYPSKTKKQICQTILDINPSGQSYQIAGRTAPNLVVLPLYSCVVFAITTSCGIVLFKKKELK